MHEQGQIGEHLLHGVFARVLEEALEIHLHPRWDAAHQPQVLRARLADHGIDLGFPIFDAVGLPGRQPVGLKISGHVVGHDATEPAQMHPSGRHGQLWTALQENHLAVDKRRVPRSGDVAEQRVAGTADVVGHAVLGQWNVLGSRCCSARLAEIERLSRPNHILLPLHGPIHVAAEPFVITHGNTRLVLRHRHVRTKPVVATKGGPRSSRQQRCQDLALGIPRLRDILAQPTHGPPGKGQTQCGLPSHATKIALKQQGTAP